MMQRTTTSFPMTHQGVRDLDQIDRPILPLSGGRAEQPRGVNVGETERSLSLAAGALLLGGGLGKRTLLGLALATAGAALVYRGMAGSCYLYKALGINTARRDPTREYAYTM